MADVRTQQARERVALALTWAPHRPGKGGFADGIAALDDLADLVAALETALRDISDQALWQHCDWMHFHEVAMADPFNAERQAQAYTRKVQQRALDALAGAAAEPD